MSPTRVFCSEPNEARRHFLGDRWRCCWMFAPGELTHPSASEDDLRDAKHNILMHGIELAPDALLGDGVNRVQDDLLGLAVFRGHIEEHRLQVGRIGEAPDPAACLTTVCGPRDRVRLRDELQGEIHRPNRLVDLVLALQDSALAERCTRPLAQRLYRAPFHRDKCGEVCRDDTRTAHA